MAAVDPERIAEIRNATNGNYVLGNDRIREQVSRMLSRRVTPGEAGRPCRGSENEN